MDVPKAKAKEIIQSSGILALILVALFFPYVIGSKTLLLSVWDAPSIVESGAYDQSPIGRRMGRTPDAGAPAWASEPWLQIISHQLWTEKNPFALWNPYAAYGTPLAAAMQPQPFYPLTILASLKVTPWTYSLFVIARLLVAGVLMFLFARLFLDRLSSIVAGTAFMLNGYFAVFLNMPHLSVEVMTPGLLLTFELILRTNRWTAVAGAAGMILLCLLGGMPESAFVSIALASLYFVGRLLFTAEFRKMLFPLFVKFVAAGVLGFALAGFLLLPFVELLRISHDLHQPSNVGGIQTGLIADVDPRRIAQYFLPLLFGPISHSIFGGFLGWTGLWAYWGIVPCLLGFVALIWCVFPGSEPRPRGLRFLIAFFAFALLLMLLKRFGHPAIQWVGRLPIAEMVLYPKYLEPLMGLCVAVLAAVGFSIVHTGRTGTRVLGSAALIVLCVTLGLAWSYWSQVPSSRYALFFYVSVVLGVLCLVTAVAILSWFLASQSLRTRHWLGLGLFGLLTIELCISYIVPTFYAFNAPPPASRNPYKGAPFIDFVREKNNDYSRIFGRESLLYPNWSGAFELADVRSLDALHTRRYFAFIRHFLAKPGDTRLHGDLADRFTGSEFPFSFETDAEKRFLVLSSIKYLLSSTEFAGSKVIDAIVAQHRDEKIWGFGPDIFEIGDESKSVRGLLQHPPSRRISYKTTIDANTPFFEGVAAIKRDAMDKSDGVGFQIEMSRDASFEMLFTAALDPRSVPADRNGRAFRIDLSKYAGQEIELLFSTDAGPSGNDVFDWGGWAGLRFVGTDSKEDTGAFKKIYDKEKRVYEVPGTLPRASLFSAIEIMPESEVLTRLTDPAFKLDERVLISRESVSEAALPGMQSLAEAAPTQVTPARILNYQSQRVTIESDASRQSLLMLTDANYPGWNAYVNGQPVPSVAANFLFRGVVVPPGKNLVEFVYEPTSFRIGGMVSLAAFLILGGLMFHERRKTRAADVTPA